MRLPTGIYLLVKKYFEHHACWHEMRSPNVPKEQREKCFPGLHAIGEPGAGEDFLEFHREMIRNFKWIVKTAPGAQYEYQPWRDFPEWVAGLVDAFSSTYRHDLEQRLATLVSEGTLDELGVFIEGGEKISSFANVHWVMHGIISGFENLNFGIQKNSDMGNMATAPCNEHFWEFHGWIDSIYADWQRNNGQLVNQSPEEPIQQGMCEECHHMKASAFTLPNEVWQKYLHDVSY